MGTKAIAWALPSASLPLVSSALLASMAPSGWLTRTLRCLGVSVVVTRLFYLTRTTAPLSGLLSLLLSLRDLSLLSSCLTVPRFGVQVPLLSWQVLMRTRRVEPLSGNRFPSLCVTAKAGEMTGLSTPSFVLKFRVKAAPFVLSGFERSTMLLLRARRVIRPLSLCTVLLAAVLMAMAPVAFLSAPLPVLATAVLSTPAGLLPVVD